MGGAFAAVNQVLKQRRDFWIELRKIGILVDNKNKPVVPCITERVIENCFEGWVRGQRLVIFILSENLRTQRPEFSTAMVSRTW